MMSAPEKDEQLESYAEEIGMMVPEHTAYCINALRDQSCEPAVVDFCKSVLHDQGLAAVGATLCRVELDTADLKEEYFQGWLDASNIHRAIRGNFGNYEQVEYVGTRQALEAMVRKFFWTNDPTGAEDAANLASIAPVGKVPCDHEYSYGVFPAGRCSKCGAHD
jgi:hypothetical protein